MVNEPVHTGLPAAGSAAPPTELFRGNPSWKAQLGAHVAAAILGVAGIAACFLVPDLLGQSSQVGLITGAVLALGGLGWAAVLWVKRFVQFRINTVSIDVESGLIGKRVDTVQLWKVRDITYRQTATDRMLGLARIAVVTQDPSTPDLDLWGLPASREVFEKLKQAVETARRRGGVLGVIE